MSSDGRTLLSASRDKTVRFWDTNEGRQIGEPILAHEGVIYALALHPINPALRPSPDGDAD